jgi:hypothetical protein
LSQHPISNSINCTGKSYLSKWSLGLVQPSQYSEIKEAPVGAKQKKIGEENMKNQIAKFIAIVGLSLIAMQAKAQSGGGGPGVGICYIYVNGPCPTNSNVPLLKWFVDQVGDVSDNAVHCSERAKDYKNYCTLSPLAPPEVLAAYQVSGINVSIASTNPDGHLYLWDGTTWILTSY